MMSFSGKLHIFSAVLVGGGSFITGVIFEKFYSKPTVLAKTHFLTKEKPIFPDSVDSGVGILDGHIAQRAAEIMQFGYPNVTAVRVFDNYIISYDKRTKTAIWVFEHLTRDNLYKTQQKPDRNNCQFQEDNFIHPFFRATNEDFRGSGYDRGHLAPAANQRFSQDSQCQTFFLTNVAPQVGKGFNQGDWNKLEKYTRYLTKHYKDVFVCTGSLFLPKTESDKRKYVKYEVIGRNHVAVPTHFFKVLLLVTASGQFEMEAYLLPNQDIRGSQKMSMFQVPPNSIERAAGFHIFDRVPRDQIVRINGVKHAFE